MPKTSVRTTRSKVSCSIGTVSAAPRTGAVALTTDRPRRRGAGAPGRTARPGRARRSRRRRSCPVSVKTRSTSGGPRRSTSRRPSCRARALALTMACTPELSMNASSRMSSDDEPRLRVGIAQRLLELRRRRRCPARPRGGPTRRSGRHRSTSSRTAGARAFARPAIESGETCGRGMVDLQGSVDLRSQIVLPAAGGPTVTMDALRRQRYSARQAAAAERSVTPVRRRTTARDRAISSSSTRSVGARMKTSHIMSGSCWLPLMKPITWRPVASSITA